MIPEFLDKPERARHRRDRPEQEHRATRRPSSRSTSTWPMKTDELILIHTPHLEDKYKGTRMIIDMLKNDRRVKPERVLHRSRRGAHGPARPRQRLLVRHDALPDDEVHAGSGPCDIIEMVGTDRIMANSAGDWGKSDPLAVPELIQEMKRRGHAEAAIRKVVYDNPLAFWRQANNWQEWPPEPSLNGVRPPRNRRRRGTEPRCRGSWMR